MTQHRLFIIQEDLVNEVSKMLEAFIDHIDADCSSTGCMCDLRGEACSHAVSVVLHRFESSLCVVPNSKTK
jgi:hypothetical protein